MTNLWILNEKFIVKLNFHLIKCSHTEEVSVGLSNWVRFERPAQVKFESATL